jgi:hypothetical protein
VLRLLADEDFDGDITRGLLRESPRLDVVRSRTGVSAALPTRLFSNGRRARAGSY